MNKMSKLAIHNKLSMRKFLVASIILVFFYWGCDKITIPVKVTNTAQPTLPTSAPDHVTHTTDSTVKKVLLEDYMGHFCINCPAAVTTSDALLAGTNGSQIVLMEINTGLDADTAGESTLVSVPPGLPDTAYKVNFKTAAGTAWDNTLVNTAALGWPQGMVDRVYNDALYDQDIQYSNWGTVIDSILTGPQTAAITMIDSCWIKQQIFGTQVTASLKNAPVAGSTYYLQLALVEDTVNDWQSTPTVAQQYFTHRFVLRSAINGTWGTVLPFTAANQSITGYFSFSSPNFRYNSAPVTNPPPVPARLWNMAKCSIVAFVYQRTYGARDYLVLQAQVLHL